MRRRIPCTRRAVGTCGGRTPCTARPRAGSAAPAGASCAARSRDGLEYGGHHGRPAAADVLGHAEFGVPDLVRPRLAAELQRRFHELVHPRGAYRMPPRLESAHGGDRDPAVEADFAIQPQAYASPRFAKPDASSESTDRMVKASWTSKKSMSAGLTPACS